MPIFNNSPPLSMKSQNPISTQKVQKIQLKKRAPSIKLQVNKLVKPQSQQNYGTRNYNSQHPSHHISNQSFDLNQSIEKQVSSQPKYSKFMNFQELYYKKIKQLQQKENVSDYNQVKPNNHPIFIERQVKVPVSCKNTQSTKNKYKVTLTKHGQSTKNKENLQTINAKVSSTTPPKYSESKFFKKPSQKQNNLTIFNRQDSLQKNRNKQKGEIQKGKKVLRLKKTKGRTRSDFTLNTSLEKQPNYFVDRNSLSKMQKPSFSPVNERPNISQSLSKIRISTPSQSSVSKYQSIDSATKDWIKQIIEKNIDHSKHQHVWSGVECFFSFQEFKIILCGLGFDEKNDQYVEFYVKSLWQHLGGDLYGGVVKKNMVEFLSIIFEDDSHSFKQNDSVNQQKIQSPLPRDFVESSSLKLIKFNSQLRDQLRTFYFPLRMRKIALKFDDKICNDFIPNNPKNSPDLSVKYQVFNGQRNIELTRFEVKEDSSQKMKENRGSPMLQNNAYLDSVSVRNRQPQISPCMIPKPDSVDPDANPSTVTDFSPKLSKQQYEPFQPFQSTTLPKQLHKEKLPTELLPQNQIEYKQNRKPLLSVDVSLGEGTVEKIVIYEGQDPYQVSLELKQRYNIDEQLRQKFQSLLKNHLKTLLFKIDQVSEELFQDSLQLKDHQNSMDYIAMQDEQNS